MTKAQQMLEFIESGLANGATIHVCTPLRTTAISPKTAAKWKAANNQLFKIDAEGNLRMASGNNFVIISYPTIPLVAVKQTF
jgi:hypothetical protein